MSADGEIEVSVQADGVDDAAQELSDADGGGVAGGGGGGGGGGSEGGLRGSLKAGLLAGLLTAISGPLIDVLGSVLEVLQAFLAPIASLALRLLAPFLRFMLTKILPVWLEFLNFGQGTLGGIRAILGTIYALIVGPMLFLLAIPALIIAGLTGHLDGIASEITGIGSDVWSFISGGFSDLSSDITALPGQIWNEIQQLSGMIGQEIAQRLPSVGSLGGGGGGGGNIITDNPVTRAASGGTNVNIQGGLDTFVSGVETETGVDFTP